MLTPHKIAPCLWFDSEAEQAVAFYCSIFRASRVLSVSRYGEAGHEFHGKAPGTVMAIAFELEGQPFSALNGGPLFRFSEAISFMIHCDTQDDIDYYWDRLTAGGDEQAQQCGWLKDKFGVSWQVVPTALLRLLGAGDANRAQRAMTAMLQMKKLDLAALLRACGG